MKKITQILLLAVTLFCFNQTLSGQAKKFDGILSVELRNMGTIKDGDNVSGYYLFYKTDRGKKGFANFELQVMDPELNVVFTKKLTEPRMSELFSAVSNGEGLLFKFWDPRDKKLKFIGYTYTGDSNITKSVTVSDRSELAMYENGAALMGAFGTVGVPGYGFLEISPKKFSKMSYQMKYMPSNKKTRSWTKKGSTTLFESAQHICSIDSILINVVNSRPKTLSAKEMKFLVEGINVKTGKKLFSKDLQAGKYNALIMSGAPSFDKKNIVLYGLYFPPGEKVTKKSEGLIKIVMNTKGEIIEDYKLSWTKDFNIKNTVDNDFGNMHIHEFVYGEDGKTFMVAEQFGVNGGASMLSTALARGPSIAYKINDLLIIELNKDFKIDKIEVVEKSQNTYPIVGVALGSSQMVGYFLDYIGCFDFTYLQNKNRPGDFTIGYVNFEKIKGEKNKLIFGGVTRSDGEYGYDKIPISVKGSEIRVFEGKPGYVCLMEYIKKEKSLDLRLEKINF